MNTTRFSTTTRRPAAVLVATCLSLVACGASEPADEAGPPASTTPGTERAESPPQSTPTTARQTTMPPTTAPPTTAPPTTAPPTTEPCGLSCPLTDEQQAAVDAFFEAYNGGDWDALLVTLATDEPEWSFGSTAVQGTELMRDDLIWANAMGQVTTVDKCFSQNESVIVCLVQIEDDIHRLFAPYGMEASRCKMAFDHVEDGLIPRSFNAFDCFGIYDGVMHAYGGWFAAEYPDLDPIEGVHYRGWNQTDETAGARAAEHLAEWGVEVVEFFEGGGRVAGLGL